MFKFVIAALLVVSPVSAYGQSWGAYSARTSKDGYKFGRAEYTKATQSVTVIYLNATMAVFIFQPTTAQVGRIKQTD